MTQSKFAGYHPSLIARYYPGLYPDLDQRFAQSPCNPGKETEAVPF